MKKNFFFFQVLLLVLLFPIRTQAAMQTSGANHNPFFDEKYCPVSVQCRYIETISNLELTFEFDNDSTTVSVYKNYNRMDNKTYKVYDGLTITIDLSPYGEGEYIIVITPNNLSCELFCAFGIEDYSMTRGLNEMRKKKNLLIEGNTLWEVDYCEMDNLFIPYMLPSVPFCYLLDNRTNQRNTYVQVPCRALAGLCVPTDSFSWMNVYGRGLYTWEGGTAVLNGICKDNIVEVLFDSDNYDQQGFGSAVFYTINDTLSDGCSASVRELSFQKATRSDYGHAIYEVLKDGCFGFGLSDGGAIRQISIYGTASSAITPPNRQAEKNSGTFSLNGWRTSLSRNQIVIKNGRKIIK